MADKTSDTFNGITEKFKDMGDGTFARVTADTSLLAAVGDVVMDGAHGTLTAVTTSVSVLTPPAGCKWARFSTDVDCYLNLEGTAAVNDGTSVRLIANQPETFPVTAAVAVYALSSSGTANVRATPMKVRP